MAGIACVVKDCENDRIVKVKLSREKVKDAFSGELVGILNAVKLAREMNVQGDISIVSDSQTPVNFINGSATTPKQYKALVREIQDERKGMDIPICWQRRTFNACADALAALAYRRGSEMVEKDVCCSSL